MVKALAKNQIMELCIGIKNAHKTLHFKTLEKWSFLWNEFVQIFQTQILSTMQACNKLVLNTINTIFFQTSFIPMVKASAKNQIMELCIGIIMLTKHYISKHQKSGHFSGMNLYRFSRLRYLAQCKLATNWC